MPWSPCGFQGRGAGVTQGLPPQLSVLGGGNGLNRPVIASEPPATAIRILCPRPSLAPSVVGTSHHLWVIDTRSARSSIFESRPSNPQTFTTAGLCTWTKPSIQGSRSTRCSRVGPNSFVAA